MTSLQEHTAPRLEVTAEDDLMELTSDLDNKPPADDDIDINLDLEQGDLEDLEDEYMVEDTNLALNQDGDEEAFRNINDDEMVDDDYPSNLAEETTLENYGDLEIVDYPIQGDGLHASAGDVPPRNPQTFPPNSEQDFTTLGTDQALMYSLADDAQGFNVTEDGDSNIQKQTDLQGFELPPGDERAAKESSAELSNQERETGSDSNIVNRQGGEEDVDQEGQYWGGQKDEDSQHNESQELAKTLALGYVDEAGTMLEEPQSLEGENSGGIDLKDRNQEDPEDDAKFGDNAQEPNSRNIHPIIVTYEDNEMLLFPPVDQDTAHSQTFLLGDETLINENLSQLFEACRLVLASSISNQDELEVEMRGLNLCISENSLYASRYSLAQILDTYLQLHHADGLENPEPLYMTLCTKTAFSSRFDSLMSAVSRGMGFSQINLSQDYGSEREVEYDEEGEDSDESTGEDLAGNQPTADYEDNNGDDGSIQSYQEQQDSAQPPSKDVTEALFTTTQDGQAGQFIEQHSSVEGNKVLESTSSAQADGIDISNAGQADLGDRVNSTHESSTASSTIQGDGIEEAINDHTNARDGENPNLDVKTIDTEHDDDVVAEKLTQEVDGDRLGDAGYESSSKVKTHRKERSSNGGLETPNIVEEDTLLDVQHVNTSPDEFHIVLDQVEEIDQEIDIEKDDLDTDASRSLKDLSAATHIGKGDLANTILDTAPDALALEEESSEEIGDENSYDHVEMLPVPDDKAEDPAITPYKGDGNSQTNTENDTGSSDRPVAQDTEGDNLLDNFDLDNDEITYEDDDDDTEVIANLESESNSQFDAARINSTGSLKRVRASDEEDSSEDSEQDLKRVRS